MTIPDLIERLEKAEGPSRGLDGRIAWALGWRFNGFIWDGDPIGGPDTVEDFEEWEHIGGSWHQPGDRFINIDETWDAAANLRWPEPPEWTASIDAAVKLCELTLPGWVIDFISQDFMSAPEGYRGIGWTVELINQVRLQGQAPKPAIALCIAILRALQAKEGE
jgi:hypothetical protein